MGRYGDIFHYIFETIYFCFTTVYIIHYTTEYNKNTVNKIECSSNFSTHLVPPPPHKPSIN